MTLNPNKIYSKHPGILVLLVEETGVDQILKEKLHVPDLLFIFILFRFCFFFA